MKASVVIIGAGMVGLSMAKALAQANIDTVVVEAAEFNFDWKNEPLTARASSLNLASIEFLKSLNVRDDIDNTRYGLLRRLFVWDGQTHSEIEFDAADAGQNKLGVIVENREVVRTLYASLKAEPKVRIIAPAKPKDVTVSDSAAELILEDGTVVQAQLIIGADGGRSWLREQQQIVVHERPYRQTSIVCCVQTQKPHQFTGWQVFHKTGPLALLPLHNKHQCAIVWSNDTARSDELMQLDDMNFTIELNNAFGPRLGDIETLTKPKAFPLVMRHAENYVKNRIALVGDAAHSIHPLAGQGVNLGFADAKALSEILTKPNAFGSLYKNLRRYERARKEANSVMLAAMRGFRDLFSMDSAVVLQARALGMHAVDKAAALKRWFMQLALGSAPL